MKTSFWKIMLASMVGFILASLLFIFIFVGSISALVSKASKPEPVEVEEKSVIKMELSTPVPDRTPQNPFGAFNFDPYDMKKIIGLNDILKSLEKAEEDDNIEGIFLDLNVVSSGMATLQEIRDAIIDFKEESDKWVICYADMMSQKSYYLATAADKIYLNPQGYMDFRGLSAQVMYFKSALEKLGVEPQIFRHGKYKSAVEPFMSNTMSEENREQTLTYTKNLWTSMLEGISEERDITVDRLNTIADSLLLSDAESAVDHNFVDDLKYKDEIIAMINEKMGEDKDEEIEYISLAKYKKSSLKKPAKSKIKDDSEIAVIFAEGQIVVGKGDDKTIGGERFSGIIRDARTDEDIKAIVLRVNSPGGSGLSSEKMWRELNLAAKEKPLVVSMGNYAASGGYYISAPADYIYTHHTTITGSIGVFGIMFTAEELLEDKLGINLQTVKTNTHSDMGNISREWKDKEKQHMQDMVENFYDIFLTRVAGGRNMTKEEVDKIGQGRVWSGINAVKLGLADDFGGLEEAMKKAADLAEIDDYEIKEYPKMKDFMKQILKQISMQQSLDLYENIPGIKSDYAEQIEYIKNIDEGVQARMPSKVEFE